MSINYRFLRHYESYMKGWPEKIDTKTTEHKVLEGAKNVLERDEPIIICEVLKGKTEKYLHSLLANTDYR